MRTSSSMLAAIAVLAILPAREVRAEIPFRLGLEGKLGPDRRDTGGGNDRITNMRITIEDASATALHVEDHCGVSAIGRDGEFSLALGMADPFDALLDGPLQARVQACYDREGCEGVTDVSACRPRDYVEVIIPLDPVAYAHVSRNAELLDGMDSDTFLQELSFAHPDLAISDGNTVGLGSLANSSVAYTNSSRTLSVTDGSGTLVADLGPLSQTIARSGLDVTLSNGGGTFSVADDDSDPANELQTVSRTGTNVTLSHGGGTFSINDNDPNPTNELQTLAVSGSTLSISSGNSVSIPGDDLGSHVATQSLDMGMNDIRRALTGEFADLGRFGNHALSSRVAASNASIDAAVFGANEATSGFEVGVYGRTQSPAGWGVFSDGNLGTSGQLNIGTIPPGLDDMLLVVDGAGNVRGRHRSTLATYGLGQVTDVVGYSMYQTWDLACTAGMKAMGGGSVDHGDPDLDCFIQSTGLNGAARHLTRVLCTNECDNDGECNGETFVWTITCGNP